MSRQRKEQIRRRGRFLLALALSAAVLTVCFSYLMMAQEPPERLDLSPWTQPEVWTFAQADGTAVEPDGEGLLPLAEGETLYCSRTLPEDLRSNVLLAVDGSACDVAVLVDGALVADLSHRFAAGAGFPAPAPETGGLGGLVSLGDASGRRLTLAVQFLQEEPRVGALPSLSLYREIMDYLYQGVASGAAAGLPAGVFLAAALFLLGLFLFLLWKGRADWGLLFLTASALAFCLRETTTYSIYAVAELQAPAIAWATHCIPALPLLGLLWYRSTGRARRYGWPLPLGAAAAVLLCVCLDPGSGASYVALRDLVQGKLLPLAALLLLLEGAWEAARGSQWHRRFWAVTGSLLALGAVGTGLWGTWPQVLAYLQFGMSWGSYFRLLDGVDHLLLGASFLLAVSSFVQETARRDAALETTALQKRYAEENAAALLRSLEATRQARHEIRHHMEAVRALCQAGDLERVRSYAEQLCASPLNAPALYTRNGLVNAVLAARLDPARSEGVQIHAFVQVPERLAIDDVDLAAFLTNLLDNAVEAARSASGARRFLDLRMELRDGWLLLQCENGYDGVLHLRPDGSLASGKGEQGHGYGLRIMGQVAEKHGGRMEVAHEDGRFRVRARLALESGGAGPERSEL